ncbi:MAG: hypothetical protein NWE95_03845 [Candidatus Bathyarchaeota archaeon]|jgi:hypothetical protein|nr:hypothetical protein [Candidatus Bathyarchaeota archaeon]
MVKQSKQQESEIYIIGIQIDKCDICRKTKKVFLLRYGLTLCEDCLTICTQILEQLEANTNITKKEVAQI